ncbi:MAG: hypothetical protein A2V21_312225 [Deltaproteobacteria bacterium GWC2_55_46]|nr:MAG: hypothetical protein A2Z79_07230 [Deltaproteobacteria bacterium GWA2_55_82]OIJ74966.1 MAG: hypothetical protein A2V21_312225 [Deltaproteobacteria bacterium GWC2_55_46]
MDTQAQDVMKFILSITLWLSVFLSPAISFSEEYTFEIPEIEKKPYSIGGFIEARPALFGLDKAASLYKLRFYGRDEGATTYEYNARLQLDFSAGRGPVSLFARTNTDYKKSYLGESQGTIFYEAYLSLQPASGLSIEIGKKALRWGKGYAWNPVAFVDRPKDPDDPELNLEGFTAASVEYIKSFTGPLKTASVTAVLVPVYSGVNDGFGDEGLNFAGKLYLLLYDTDIDLIVLAGDSKATSYGFDFATNISTNFEVHGELAIINDFRSAVLDRSGNTSESRHDSLSYLLGIRYLTERETTYIIEYYHNGTGFTAAEMRDYFSFIDDGYETFLSTGNDSLLRKAFSVTDKNYGRINPMRDYLYVRVSQKDPFDRLYWTPAITSIVNLSDMSYSISPEVMYAGVTDLELRLKASFISGGRLSEYGEKQNDYRVEFRARYYF